MMVQYLVLGKHSSEWVGLFVWTIDMANTLLNMLSGFWFYFGDNAPEYQPVLPFVLPVEVPPDMHAEYAENREEIINHNINVETGWAETANTIGQMVAQLVNELRPERTPHLQIKLDMPDCYDGDLAEIDNWLWSMETYFMLTKVTDQMMIITLQQIKKGKGNQAGVWSAVKLKELEKEFEVWVVDGTMPWEATMRQRSDGMVAGGLLVAPLWHKLPFEDWIQFWDEAQEFFMTMETQDKAIRALHNLKQGYLPVEDYIVQFKSLVPLTEFNDYALVVQFKAGLHLKLGYDIVRAGAPADNDLEAWYTWSTEMARAFQDAKMFYRDQGSKRTTPWVMNAQVSSSLAKKEETKPTVKEEMHKVKLEWQSGPFKCYNCQKEGHIAWNCKEPRRDKGKYKARAVDINWKELWENVSEDDKKEISPTMGFASDQ